MSKPNADDLLETIWPICPNCGFENRDAWELELDEYFTDGWECGSCLRAMLIKRNVYVTYTTAEPTIFEVKQ